MRRVLELAILLAFPPFLAALLPVPAAAQTASLLLSSGSGSAGAPVSLNLTLSNPSAVPHAGLQFTLQYATADFSAMSVAAGAAASSAGKSVSCNPNPGQMTCLIWGLNTLPIPNGAVAVVTATPAASAAATRTIQVTPMAASTTAQSLAVTGNQAAIQVGLTPPDTTPPTVSLTLPPSGATLSGTVALSASASDNVGVTRVEFLLNGTKIGEKASAPYSINWSSLGTPNGTYLLTARAFDAAGNSATATGATVQVLNSANPTGLITAFPLGEGSGNTVLDISGNNNTGTINQAQWSTQGRFGNALSFNGTNASVGVNASPSLDLTTALTLQAWVRPSVVNDYETILLKERPGGLAYALYLDSTARPLVELTIGGPQSLAAPSPIPMNTWTHLAATYNGSTVRLFINGVEVASRALAGAVSTSTAPLRLGGNAIWNTEFYQGLLDEVRIYNRALSLSEIQTDMNTALAGTPSPTPAPTLSSVSCNPLTIVSGASATCNVSLSASATSNVVVSLSNNNPSLSVPPSVTVPAGRASAAFTAVAGTLPADATATITATFGGATTSVTLSLSAPPRLTSLSCSPAVVPAATSALCTVAFNKAVTANVSVAVSDDNASLTVPSAVALATSQISANFTITAGNVLSTQPATITASHNGVTVNTTVQLAAPPSTNGLITAFPMNEGSGTSIADVSPQNHTGAITQAQWTTQGRFGAALSFNGTGALVSVNSTSALNLTTALTLQAWVRPTAVNDYETVLLKERPGGLSYALYLDSAARPLVELTAGGAQTAVSPSPIPLNTWTHLAATYDGSMLRLYVNGAEAASRPLSGSITTSSSPLRLGGNTIWNTEFYQGLIDEVRIYNRALSQSELQTDMNRAITGTPGPAPAPRLSSLSCSPISLTSGAAATCTVSLTGPVSSGAVIALTANSPSLTVPPSVTISAGGSTAGFTAAAGSLSVDLQATVTATYAGVSAATTLNLVAPPRLSSIACVPALMPSGASSQCTVLFNKALTANAAVTLSSSSASLTVPSPVTVSSGQSSGSFTATAGTVLTTQWASITASHNGISSSISVQLAAAPDRGLITAFPMNEGTGAIVPDVSGQNNTGTLNQAQWSTAGKFGGALSFNGNNASVSIPSASSLNLTTALTLQAWVRPTAVNGFETIILKERPGGLAYALYLDAAAKPLVELTIAGVQALAAPAAVPMNTWTHLAATYDGSSLRLYVNGAQVATRAVSGPVTTSNSPLRLGGNSVWSNEFYQGLIDEVRLYNRALTQSEIQTGMNTALTTPVPATLSRNGRSPAIPATLTDSNETAGDPDTGAASPLPHLASLRCRHRGPEQRDAAICTVLLKGPAAAQAVIAISASPGGVAVPREVLIREGQSGAEFLVTARRGLRLPATVFAASNGVSLSTGLVFEHGDGPAIFAPARLAAELGDPVRFTVEAAHTEGLPVFLAASALPAGARFDSATGQFEWEPSSAAFGSHELEFVATDSTGRRAAATVPIDVVRAGPHLTQLVHGATRSTTSACTPGSIASLQGTALFRDGEQTSLRINGGPAWVLRVSPAEVTFQCPDLPGGTPLTLQVQRGALVSNLLESAIRPEAPGIFSQDGTGAGQGVALWNGTTRLAMFRSPHVESQPALRGDEVSLLVTGLGSAGSLDRNRIQVLIAGVAHRVESLTTVAPGIYALSVRIADRVPFGATVPVQLEQRLGDGSLVSSNSVTLAVESRDAGE